METSVGLVVGTSVGLVLGSDDGLPLVIGQSVSSGGVKSVFDEASKSNEPVMIQIEQRKTSSRL